MCLTARKRVRSCPRRSVRRSGERRLVERDELTPRALGVRLVVDRLSVRLLRHVRHAPAMLRIRVVSLSCCDALPSILETGVRWYAVGQGTLRAPDTPATHPSSRHDLSGPLPSLGSRVATYAAIQLHGSAPALVTVLASFCAVTRNGNTPTTTTVVSRTTSGPWRTRSCAV